MPGLKVIQSHRLTPLAASAAVQKLLDGYKAKYGIAAAPFSPGVSPATYTSQISGSLKGFTFTGLVTVTAADATIAINEDPPWYVPTGKVRGAIAADLAEALNGAQLTQAKQGSAPLYASYPTSLGLAGMRRAANRAAAKVFGSETLVGWGNGTTKTVSGVLDATARTYGPAYGGPQAPGVAFTLTLDLYGPAASADGIAAVDVTASSTAPAVRDQVDAFLAALDREITIAEWLPWVAGGGVLGVGAFFARRAFR